MSKPKVTIYTIANEVGVSASTVSRAFDPRTKVSPKTRRRILDTAQRLGYVSNKHASRLSSDPMWIGVLIYGYIPAFYNEYITGLRDAHAEYADYKVNLDLRVLSAQENGIDDIHAVLDQFVASGYEGVIVCGLRKAKYVDKLNQLTEAGIKLIVLGGDLEGSLRDGVAMNDFVTTGEMAAQLLRCAMGKSGNVAVFAESVDNANHRKQLSSFCSASATYGNHISAVYYTDNIPETAELAAENMLASCDDIMGIYISTANSIPILNALDRANKTKQFVILASDVFLDLNQRIRNGDVFATIYQNPYQLARAAFETLAMHLLENEPITEFILSRPKIVMSSNLHLYEKNNVE